MIPEERSVAERVVQAVAITTNTDPMDLPPLAETIDPDALGAVTESFSDGDVSFQYAGYLVTVDGVGTVELEKLSTRSESTSESATGD